MIESETNVAFTPKGGCPLKPVVLKHNKHKLTSRVAFTPKGGCPLKPNPLLTMSWSHSCAGSIHPQGWVPIETYAQKWLNSAANCRR